jgi:hypothetical protein
MKAMADSTFPVYGAARESTTTFTLRFACVAVFAIAATEG